MQRFEAPARRPCDTCPYRRDVPSGIWDPSEYAKLPRYDRPTIEQSEAVWRCHTSPVRVCAGWAGCHDGDELMALRIAVLLGAMTAETAEAVRDYTSPVPLFASGAQAAAHGLRDADAPGPQARAAIAMIQRLRNASRWPSAAARPRNDSGAVVSDAGRAELTRRATAPAESPRSEGEAPCSVSRKKDRSSGTR
ncbi:DUF6283 family protein [Actinomadura geliboluensis]|uniref:DUF6283 family protein n=1 Tax=Actinomadura geliboluensis TaxID=882440 RepID=UPI003719F6D4